MESQEGQMILGHRPFKSPRHGADHHEDALSHFSTKPALIVGKAVTAAQRWRGAKYTNRGWGRVLKLLMTGFKWECQIHSDSQRGQSRCQA